ncbi:MAG: carbamoyltransferase HypF [Candidatus Bathyarchaeia archaeon]
MKPRYHRRLAVETREPVLEITVGVTVHGVVQGVGFRPFIYRNAVKLGLRGYVRNRGDAVVEIALTGQEHLIQEMIRRIKVEHPPLARIERIDVKPIHDTLLPRFSILKSDEAALSIGSIVPADIAVCDKCVTELRNVENRRYCYFFITCTECGPRFTIIEGLPYDRENTSMKEFTICEECREEYGDPLDRRFHAQTIACQRCGPTIKLTDVDGMIVEAKRPIEEAGKLIQEGFIVAVKGNGGYHIAASTMKPKPILKLREAKHRSQKPFAVMAKDLKSVKKFAYLTEAEKEILTSHVKPILLLKLREDSPISRLVAPGLKHIGVMLPYTALHVMLFDEVDDPAIIMTSANPPNQPIITSEEEAYEKLGDVCDYFLTHNRRIVNRCDDSVLKLVGGEVTYLRRSRGYTPLPILVEGEFKRTVLAIGGELNNTACLITGNKAFLTQHIGDVETIETERFLEASINHLIRITRCHVDAMACDLHPTFNTTKLGMKLSERLGVPLYRIQHHYAHASTLMAEHSVEKLIAIVCDGYGYGLDGNAWGGEIVYSDEEGYERIGHMQEYPLIGGDQAAKHPLRMLAAILFEEEGFEQWFLENSSKLPRGRVEAELVLKLARKGNGLRTSSCGRLLDAISSLLGVCYHRTYEGEPAMKLEAAAYGGKPEIELPYSIEGDVIVTRDIVKELFRNLQAFELKDLAYSALTTVGVALADYALREAERLDVNTVGFTGGVAYNEIIYTAIKRRVERAGFNFISCRSVPCGDGGLSLGQAYSAQRELV